MIKNNNNNDASELEGRLFIFLVWASVALTFMTVVLSAYIRLSVNGLGCDGWPECYGQIGSPEQYTAFDSISDANIVKPHGLARAAHRLVASTLGFFVLLILIQAFRRRAPEHAGILVPSLAFAVTVFLAILGYLTPSPWLPVVTLSNLMGGMVLLALTWWLAQGCVDKKTAASASNSTSTTWVTLGLVLFVVQVSLGAWNSANFAGPACTTLIGCDEQALPLNRINESFSLFRELSLDEDGKVLMVESSYLINTAHRVFALLTMLYLAGLAIVVIRAHNVLYKSAWALLVLLGIEVGLGVVMGLMALPLFLVAMHNACAAVLLIVLVDMLHAVTRKSDRHEF